jgi:predicted PurR-regulated permease PerM
VQQLFEKYNIDPKILQDIVDFLHLDEDYNIGFDFGAIISPLYTTAKSILTGVVNLIFALVVCIYALLSKPQLHHQVRRMGYSIFPEKIARYLGHVYVLVRDTYSKFLSAQCIEAVILGVMMFLAFSVFKIPYAGLVAVLTALFAFLPFIGAFGACFIGGFLTLVAEPRRFPFPVAVETLPLRGR